ncbi:division/cell wall cluster transcriptional repressor MraZ [Candidatus Falkowbacteria bacterium]|nr:division/cell wall cluster transcriptional repressor MraZ [Candidatus Falkowbacteria bacterium]
MFIGEYKHTVDDKGRLALPSKFKSSLLKGAVVTRGLDNCLYVYTLVEWEKLAIKLAALPISKQNTRAFARLMLAGAMDVSLDKQGRIILPEYLREYAKLQKRVVITGLYSHLEIWDEKSWESYKKATEKDSSNIAEALDGLDV